jgi:hypothetical protein
MDEYNYLYQAKIFATGHLWLNASQKVHDLFENYMIFSNGKLFTQYSPGFSLLLLPGVKLGIPGLINPLLSVITLVFLYLLCAEFVGSFLSILAVSLVASNIYFLGYGASYFVHPASLCLTSMALYFFQRYRATKRESFLVLSMSFLSFHFLVRSLDALCLWAALCLGVLLSGQPRKRSLVYCALPVIGILFLLGYNKVLMGQWSIAPYPVFSIDFKLIYGGHQTIGSYAATMFFDLLRNLNANLWYTFGQYFLPLTLIWLPYLALGLFGERPEDRGPRSFGTVLFAYSLLLIGLYCFEPMIPETRQGWPQYGARYWYPLIAPLAFMIAAGIKGFYQRLPRRSFWILLGLCFLFQFIQSAYYLDQYSQRFHVIRQLQADIDSQFPPKSIVVLNDPNNWHDSAPDFTYWYALERNPFLNADRLYVGSGADLNALKAAYPGYTVRNYYFPEPYYYGNLALLAREAGYSNCPSLALLKSRSTYANSVAFTTPVTTFKGNAYICYLSDSRDVIVAKWMPGGKAWQKTRIAKRIAPDAHNNFSVGIDSADYVHVSFGMRGKPLQYFISEKPEDVSRFHREKMTGVGEDKVTYPHFFKSPSSELYFIYRNGPLDNSDLNIKQYDTGTRKWTDVAAPLIRGSGSASSVSPYEFTAAWDAKGNMHLFWNWRKKGDKHRTEIFDVLYAKYDKSRSRWERSNGKPYSLPITGGNAEVIDSVGMNLGLLDQNSVVFDGSGYPHVVYEKFAPDGHSEIFHARYNGSSWRITQVMNLHSPVTWNLYDLWRPQILINRTNTIYIFFTDSGIKTSRQYILSPGWLLWTESRDNGATWAKPKAIKEPRIGEFAYDPVYLRETGNLRFYYQTNSDPVSPLYSIDFAKKP